VPGRVAIRPAVVAVALIVSWGCGGDGDRGSERAVAEQVERYYRSLVAGDSRSACDVLSESAKRGFEAVLPGRVSADCETNVETLSNLNLLRGRPRVSSVEVTGNRASAHVSFARPPFQSDVLLAREDGVWKVSQMPGVLVQSLSPPGSGGHSDE
jgi:hypothetical protein